MQPVSPRVVELLKRREVAAALISAGGSTIYGLGSPPAAAAWTITLQDPADSRKTAFTIALKDRALSVAGSSEKSFEADGVRCTFTLPAGSYATVLLRELTRTVDAGAEEETGEPGA